MSTDASGNTATATQTVTVRDVTPPSVVVPANMTLNAVAPGGARVTYSVGASDNVSVTSVSCTIPSGSVFPIGVTTTTCTASDAAANRASSAFAVTILGAHDQIENLIAYVSGLHLPNGTANPLLAQLQGAYISSGSGDVAGACSKLSSFISTVVKKSSSIPPAEANQMLGDSRRIMNVLGC
jgi:hypothetical protein